ncbi:MAG: hypothetical protein AVDCRST_MAG28-1351 [uncultured Rubrobacteraceae bacterium]|uniref:AI-2E family transporter n=1 Tax=uncultured Rubrobacteraceae bacterium TaxID=349277 RepID=A0A6J4QWS2_9ACTN|nr:MAG: hypothetical protein AVDCRST_MAG28-1351 [uncultured Rubrobacteraceae bacterium]
MRVTLTNRGLLQAVLLAFAPLLVYQFLAAVVATVLLLAAGLLLAVALSAPVELLHRHKVPRLATVALIVLVILAVLGLGGSLLLPVLAEQISQLASYLPDALSQLVERLSNLASRLGIQTGGGSISPSTLASIGRRELGGVLGIFSGFASFLSGLVVILFVPLYLAAMPEPVERWVVRLFPPRRREKARKVLRESRESLLGWLGGRLFSMLVVGVLSTIALYVIGIPGALFFEDLLGARRVRPDHRLRGRSRPAARARVRRGLAGRSVDPSGIRGDTANREQPPYTPGHATSRLTSPGGLYRLRHRRGRRLRRPRRAASGPDHRGSRGPGRRAVVPAPGREGNFRIFAMTQARLGLRRGKL